MIEGKPELVNCVAKQPPKKDDGQSPLQVAIKTGNFDITNLLIDSGADINFIEGEDSYDDWRMPVLNYAILAAVMNCRYTLRMDFGDRIYEEEKSTEERADAAFGVLKRLLESGADVRGRFMFFVTLLDQIYWVTGSTIGGLVGSLLHFNTDGISFVMTAMFVVIFLEQWLKDKQHTASYIGLGASVICLIIFGADSFMVPAMISIVMLLAGLKKPIEKRSETLKK